MMFAGFDTSNYTTSAALYDGERIYQQKKPLEVKAGERGLRQSEALFQHTVNIPSVIRALAGEITSAGDIKAIGVSSKPRNFEGSYMPCFLAGVSAASAAASILGVPLYETSHQVGHILAALYSADRLDLIDRPFISFHISGGTTEALLVTPDNADTIKAEIIAESSDLKAGQAIDRTGVLLGLHFPCGGELDKLARESGAEFKIKPSIKGFNCSLSGVENKVKKMLSSGESKRDIAKYAISYICASLDEMTERLIEKYGDLPILFAGGVSCNSEIRSKMVQKYGALFAAPEFSCDNAAGTAVFARLKFEREKGA